VTRIRTDIRTATLAGLHAAAVALPLSPLAS
jgi:hypothetical protein